MDKLTRKKGEKLTEDEWEEFVNKLYASFNESNPLEFAPISTGQMLDIDGNEIPNYCGFQDRNGVDGVFIGAIQRLQAEGYRVLNKLGEI